MVATSVNAQHERELHLLLIAERDRLRARMRSLADAARAMGMSQNDESRAGGEHADVGSDLLEQELDFALEQAELHRLIEIEAALQRIDERRFGRCEGCGQPIPGERLTALPWTRWCITCARGPKYGPAPQSGGAS